MRRRAWLIVIAVVAIVPIVSLGLPRIARLLEPEGDESVYVVLKTTGPHMEFWQIVRAGIQAAATELNVDPQIVGPQWEKDIDRQIEILAEVIEADPDAILLAASDYNRLVPLAEEAAARGITVVTLDSALNSEVPVSFVATDNVAAGMEAGREIDRLVPRDRAIAVISHIRGVATAIDRENGVLGALAHRDPDLVLGPFYSQNDPDLGREIVVNLLAEHPDLGGIVAMNENSTVGAGRALEALGAWDDIALVGFDNSQEEIEFLEDGIVKALVVQRPFNMGYVGISTLVDALRGTRVERVIYTDAVLVRKEDMFSEENQKLLFPIVQRR
ncbi:MAG TPA: substrate-binding domain-containing protein [Spirochaetia bacterium]|nr:substrate-binding domain-containing protein [Spirochaetia bacterium]